MTPRKPSKPESFVPTPSGRTKRDRSWETEQRTLPGMTTITFRRIPQGISDRIGAIAGEIHVSRDEVGRALLDYALGAYDDRDLTLDPVLKNGKLTLFPEI